MGRLFFVERDQMEAILDRVIIKPEPKKERSGLIFIPEDSKPRPQRGTVTSIGPGKVRREDGVFIPTELKPGDTVLYSKHDGIDFNDNGEDLVCILEQDIVAKEE
jgi:chaperonin GroES